MDEEKETDSATTAADWADLTHECLLNILRRLSLEDRWRGAMRVCKAWHQACKDPCLNSVLNIESHFGSGKELPRFWTPEFERRVDNMLRSVVLWSSGGLTQIHVRHCSDRSLALVAKRCPNLQVLCIRSSPHVTDAIMAEIASGCPKIKMLDISYCYKISDKSLAVIGSRCPNMLVLKRNLINWVDPSQYEGVVPYEYVKAYPRDGDSEAAAIAKFMPHLLYLDLRFFLGLTSKGVTLISEGCQDLEYIDLTGCANVTGRDIAYASLKLKNLETIKKPNFYIPRSFFKKLFGLKYNL